MGMFTYHIAQHLYRPASPLTNVSYTPGTSSGSNVLPITPTVSESSTVLSPFDGNAINNNFYYLALAATDLTYQNSIYQTYPNNSESPNFGFVNYNGRQELESNFYGGSPLNLVGTTPFTLPYQMDSSTTKAFQVAAQNGILYTTSGSVNQSTSNFRGIIFGEASNGSPFSTANALATYMNSKLKFSSNDGTNTFTFTGTQNPTTASGQLWTTLNVTPRSFWIWWNDGYTQYTNGLTSTDASGFIHLGKSTITNIYTVAVTVGQTPSGTVLINGTSVTLTTLATGTTAAQQTATQLGALTISGYSFYNSSFPGSLTLTSYQFAIVSLAGYPAPTVVIGGNSPATYSTITLSSSTNNIINSTSTNSIVGCKVTLSNAVAGPSLGNIQAAIQNALSLAIGNTNTFTVNQVGGQYLQLSISNDRTNNGIYQVTLQKDGGDVGTGILDWLSWTSYVIKSTNPDSTLPANTSEAYDYTSLFSFVPTGTTSYNLAIVGNGAYCPVSFIDNYSSGTGLLTSFGLPLLTTTYYNTRRPLTTYQKTLSYGGPFWATSLNATNGATINGNLTINGTINNNSAFNAYSLPSYTSNSGFEYNTANGGTPPNWFIYDNSIATATPSGAPTVFTYTVTYVSNPGGTLIINGATITITASASGGPASNAAMAQYLGTLTQPGYVFTYTGTNTFTISTSIPFANPSVSNGTLLSSAISFASSYSGGGTPTLGTTLLANTVNPLYGAYDAIFTKPAANYQGQGYMTPFTIDRGATGQPFQIMFYYQTGGGYLSGDLAPYIYDVTNSTIIPLSVTSIPASSSPSMFVATFYPSSSTSYRFITHIVSTNANAWTFEFDMLSIAPQSPYLTVMQAMGSMTSYTMPITSSGTSPTRGSGVTEYAGYRRIGDQVDIVWNYSQTSAGAAGTGTIYWGLPNGISIDLTKYPVGSTVGNAWLANNTNLLFSIGSVQVASSTTLQIAQSTYNQPFMSQLPFAPTEAILAFWASQINPSTTTWSMLSGTTSFLNFGVASISISFQVKVNIAQWSVQTNLAQDWTEYASNTDQTASSNSSAFYNGKDGSGFPVALSGNITKTVQFVRPMQVTDLPLIEVYDNLIGQWFPYYENRLGSLGYVNQNPYSYGMYITPISSTQFNVNFSQYARPTGSSYGAVGEAWTNYNSGSNNISRWRVRKISNGNTAEQLPIIRAEYTETSGALIEAQGSRLNFNVKVEDTNSAVTTGASTWQFTAPVPGVYKVTLFGETISSGNQALNDTLVFDLAYNGSASKRFGKYFGWAASSANPIDFNYETSIRMNPGDYIYVLLSSRNLATITAWSNTAVSLPRIIIERLGN